MQPINFDGAVTIKSNGEENCMHIYAQPVLYPVPIQAIDEKGNIQTEQRTLMFFRELWKPSAKDIENFIAGRGLWLELHCSQLVPVGMYTTDENGNIEQPVFDEKLVPKD